MRIEQKQNIRLGWQRGKKSEDGWISSSHSVYLNACEASITFYREPQLQLITIDARGPPPWIDCSEYAVLPVRKTALKRWAVDTPTANYLEVSCILSWDSTVDVYYGVTPAIMSRWWQETKPELRTGEHEFTCAGLPGPLRIIHIHIKTPYTNGDQLPSREPVTQYASSPPHLKTGCKFRRRKSCLRKKIGVRFRNFISGLALG